MKLIIITGPTGTGKTSLSIEIAKLLDTEIISADSMQIYKYMDIGTDKVTKDKSQGIKHHLIDIVYPDEDYTVENFKNDANLIINKLNNEGKIPLIVGGTGLYIDSLIYDLEFTIAPPNEDVRRYYDNLADKYGNEFLHNILNEVDPKSAEKNHPNQRKRIIRALEVYDYTGKAFSHFDSGKKYIDDIDFIYIVLNRDREKLYERINLRVDHMINEGLLDEVKWLLDNGYDKNLLSMQAIGYKELFSYLEGKEALEDSIKYIKRNSRRYAKRQLTWFRRENKAIEIFIDEDDEIEDILKKTMKVIEGKNEYN